MIIILYSFTTHVEEGLLTDVFGSSYGRRGDGDGLHLGQVDVSAGAEVFIRIVIPQLHQQAAMSFARLKTHTLNDSEDSETHLMLCYVQNEPSTLPGFQ